MCFEEDIQAVLSLCSGSDGKLLGKLKKNPFEIFFFFFFVWKYLTNVVMNNNVAKTAENSANVDVLLLKMSSI